MPPDHSLTYTEQSDYHDYDILTGYSHRQISLHIKVKSRVIQYETLDDILQASKFQII